MILMMQNNNARRFDILNTKIWYNTLVINAALYWCIEGLASGPK